MRLHLATIVLVVACGGQVTATPLPDAAAIDGQVLSDAASDAPFDAALPPPGDGIAVLSTDALNTTTLAVDALHVYWSRDVNAQSSVMRCPKAGGPTTSYLDQPYAIFVVAIDASRVYWTEGASVWSCAISGCDGWATAITAIPPVSVGGIATDGVHVFLTGNTDGTVMMCPVAGCNGLSPSTLATNQASPFAIASDGTSVFWSTSSEVLGCTIADCTQTTTVLASGQSVAVALALDATAVYWVSSKDGTVMSCAKQGCGNAPVTIASGQVWPVGVAVDDKRVYWTESSSGNVNACPKTGCVGAPTHLATGQNAPWAIAVDDTSLFWVNRSGGTIMRLHPK